MGSAYFGGEEIELHFQTRRAVGFRESAAFLGLLGLSGTDLLELHILACDVDVGGLILQAGHEDEALGIFLQVFGRGSQIAAAAVDELRITQGADQGFLVCVGWGAFAKRAQVKEGENRRQEEKNRTHGTSSSC